MTTTVDMGFAVVATTFMFLYFQNSANY